MSSDHHHKLDRNLTQYNPVLLSSSAQINQVMNKGCDERCTCAEGGQWLCLPRCSGIFIKRGKTITDPSCYEKPTQDDECCSVMVCADNAPRSVDLSKTSERLIESGEEIY